ncbi:MAG: hypothetical protein ACRDMV_00575 [Streptosporangiales bacterium]
MTTAPWSDDVVARSSLPSAVTSAVSEIGYVPICWSMTHDWTSCAE